MWYSGRPYTVVSAEVLSLDSCLFFIAPGKVLFFFFNQKLLIFLLFLHESMRCGAHWKSLAEALLMITYNICFGFCYFVWTGKAVYSSEYCLRLEITCFFNQNMLIFFLFL